VCVSFAKDLCGLIGGACAWHALRINPLSTIADEHYVSNYGLTV
jgi:hypothetical protein